MLCDFGEARFGEYDDMVDIQPFQYRAPEVIFDIPWDEKVDIWSVGVMVCISDQRTRCRSTLVMHCRSGTCLGTEICLTGGPENKQDNIYHLEHMIALLGPPPKEFLDRTKGDRVRNWFGDNGVCH